MCRAAWARSDAGDVVLNTHTPRAGDHGYDTPHKDQLVDDLPGCYDQLRINAIEIKKMNVKSIIAIKDMQYQKTVCHLVADLLRPPSTTQMPSLVQTDMTTNKPNNINQYVLSNSTISSL